MSDEFILTNLELRESTATGEVAAGLSHASMKGMFLLEVLELAATGEPRGAATVVHDAGDHGGQYRELAGELAAAGWAVALPSLRGHGGTEGARGHSAGLKEVVRDLGDIQDHLAYRLPDAPKALIGQGLGALYALVFALEHPGVIERLVLCAPLHSPCFQRPVAARGLKKLFQKIGPDSAGSIGWSAGQLSNDEAAASAYLADERVHDTITLRAIEESERASREYLPRISELEIPVLVLHGEDDPISEVAASRALGGGQVEVRSLAGRHRLIGDGFGAGANADLRSWLA